MMKKFELWKHNIIVIYISKGP